MRANGEALESVLCKGRVVRSTEHDPLKVREEEEVDSVSERDTKPPNCSITVGERELFHGPSLRV